jgi:hypothetical protein
LIKEKTRELAREVEKEMQKEKEKQDNMFNQNINSMNNVFKTNNKIDNSINTDKKISNNLNRNEIISKYKQKGEGLKNLNNQNEGDNLINSNKKKPKNAKINVFSELSIDNSGNHLNIKPTNTNEIKNGTLIKVGKIKPTLDVNNRPYTNNTNKEINNNKKINEQINHVNSMNTINSKANSSLVTIRTLPYKKGFVNDPVKSNTESNAEPLSNNPSTDKKNKDAKNNK